MKKWITVLLFFIFLWTGADAIAQCSICTKSAQQMGDKPAMGLNLSIFFLAFTPLTLIGIVWYKWRKNEKLDN